MNSIDSHFHDGGPHHIETSPLICSPKQWTGFYMIGTFIMNELKVESESFRLLLFLFVICYCCMLQASRLTWEECMKNSVFLVNRVSVPVDYLTH